MLCVSHREGCHSGAMCVCLSSVVGGLLSAHLLSHRGGVTLEPGWPCSGPLLRLAEKVARKLLPGKIIIITMVFIVLYLLMEHSDTCHVHSAIWVT